MRHHATKPPRRLGGLPVRVLFALAVAALPGCGEQSPTGPEEPAVSTSSGRWWWLRCTIPAAGFAGLKETRSDWWIHYL
jgi:hypothetical protein